MNSGLEYQTKEDILLHTTTAAVNTIKNHSRESSIGSKWQKSTQPPTSLPAPTMDINMRVMRSRGGGMGRTPRS